jgi:hypothetical protein
MHFTNQVLEPHTQLGWHAFQLSSAGATHEVVDCCLCTGIIAKHHPRLLLVFRHHRQAPSPTRGGGGEQDHPARPWPGVAGVYPNGCGPCCCRGPLLCVAPRGRCSQCSYSLSGRVRTLLNQSINKYVFHVLGGNWDPTDNKISSVSSYRQDLLPTCKAFPE